MDKGNEFGALLTDLSNAFDCIDHKLLIAKLVSSSSFNLIFPYLSNQTQRLKISYIDLRDIPSVVTQLQSTASKVFSWFTNNHMKVNPTKCHILSSTKNPTDVHLKGACITSSSCEKLLENSPGAK